MMNRLIVPGLLLPVLALAACNKQPSIHAENATIAEVAAKAKESGTVQVQPGQWTTKIALLDINMPGIKDKAMLDGMKNMMKSRQDTGVTHCITEEEAKKPPEKMFTGKDNGECRYDHFNMGGGKMDAEMTCRGRQGQGVMNMKMAGSFTSTAYDIVSEMHSSAPGMPGGEGMTMKMHVTAARTGECTGNEDVKAAPKG